MSPVLERTGAHRTVLITGASSGIGAAFAEVFAARGFDLILAARREDRLRALADRLGQAHRVRAHVLVSDLSDPREPSRLCAEIASRGLKVDVLVNNAGYGVPGTYLDSPWETHHAMVQVMVVALAELTHRLLPAMIERRYGRVINVASLAGLVPAPAGHTLYAASKALVVRFSEALSGEVAKHGVHVTALCPGFTYSEFHDVTGTREKVSKLPAWLWIDADSVARFGYEAVMAGIPVAIPGRVSRVIATLVRVVPMSIVNAVGRRLGKTYRKT
jgi:short-subunit dehydrogenase